MIYFHLLLYITLLDRYGGRCLAIWFCNWQFFLPTVYNAVPSCDRAVTETTIVSPTLFCNLNRPPKNRLIAKLELQNNTCFAIQKAVTFLALTENGADHAGGHEVVSIPMGPCNFQVRTLNLKVHTILWCQYPLGHWRDSWAWEDLVCGIKKN